MKKNKNSLAIAKLKNKSLEARRNYQLPFYLTKLIYALKGDENVKYVYLLKECTEEWLRIKGFYKKYPVYEDMAERSIKNKMSVNGFDSD